MTDLDCAAAAAELMDRAREEELVIASLQSSLPVMQAVAAALTALADRTADKPRRRSRTIRIARDDDGAMSAEDVEPVPAADGVEEAPAAAITEKEPAMPAGPFSDVFGTIGDA
jgi:hypothetical protein